MSSKRKFTVMPVLRAVEDMVALAKALKRVPAADEAARVLVTYYPECGLTADELATLFLGECIVQGVDSPEILRDAVG